MIELELPHITKGSLYEKSGHLSHYRESMFQPWILMEMNTF